jgi:hypothetical protein
MGEHSAAVQEGNGYGGCQPFTRAAAPEIHAGDTVKPRRAPNDRGEFPAMASGGGRSGPVKPAGGLAVREGSSPRARHAGLPTCAMAANLGTTITGYRPAELWKK